ncbi:hypothetical protein WJX84_001593 [Apatococcus fuscideae]|uniref:PX domain-containing protein n=1 Tax=Apatococcus fuscideae TaxID=2026836 RepID=A0AAW1TD63_9CHLO
MEPTKADTDPLSSLAFASSLEDELEEEVPLQGETQHARTSQGQAASSHQQDDYFGLPPHRSAQHEEPSRDHAVASYGQLLSGGSTWNSGFGRSQVEPHEPMGSQHVPTDPVQREENGMLPGVMGKYMSYSVRTKTNRPNFRQQDFAVRRRFRDFVALHDLLKSTHRGFFIPPRPEKNTMEGQRAQPEFIELRRMALQRYLHQLAAHPVIGLSEVFRAFLEADEPLLSSLQWTQLTPVQHTFMEGMARLPRQLLGSESAIPNPSDAARSTRHTGDLLRRFKELRLDVRQEYQEQPALTQAEIDLRNERMLVEELQEKLANASRKAEKLVSSMEDLGNVFGDLGLSLIQTGLYEAATADQVGQYSDTGAAAKIIAADCKRVGQAAVNGRRLATTGAQAAAKAVPNATPPATIQTSMALSPLHDQLGIVPAVLKALKEREVALLTVHSLQRDMVMKQRARQSLVDDGQKVFGGDKGKERKVQGLQNDMATLEQSTSAAEQEYDKVMDRNHQELVRWKAGRAEAFTTMLDNIAKVEVGYHERMHKLWEIAASGFDDRRKQAG